MLLQVFLYLIERTNALAKAVAEQFNKSNAAVKTQVQEAKNDATQKVATLANTVTGQIGTLTQQEANHYTELLSRIQDVQTTAETPIKAILQVEKTEGTLTDIFRKEMETQRKPILAGQYKIETATDGGNVQWDGGETEITAGDSFLFDADVKGNITNVRFSNDVTTNKFAAIDAQFAEINQVLESNDITAVFNGYLTA